jgi:hypothetical protein
VPPISDPIIELALPGEIGRIGLKWTRERSINHQAIAESEIGLSGKRAATAQFETMAGLRTAARQGEGCRAKLPTAQNRAMQ